MGDAIFMAVTVGKNKQLINEGTNVKEDKIHISGGFL
jgi:hypothetical protein